MTDLYVTLLEKGSIFVVSSPRNLYTYIKLRYIYYIRGVYSLKSDCLVLPLTLCFMGSRQKDHS